MAPARHRARRRVRRPVARRDSGPRDARHRGHPPTETHAYLHFLAVDPARQRQGVGSEVLKAGLVAAADRGLGVNLETTNPAAVPFYEEHGFTVRTEVTLAAGGPRICAIWRTASD